MNIQLFLQIWKRKKKVSAIDRLKELIWRPVEHEPNPPDVYICRGQLVI